MVAELVPRIAERLGKDEELVLVARSFRANPRLGGDDTELRRVAVRSGARLVCPVLPSVVADRIGAALPAFPLDRVAGPLDVFHGSAFRLPVSRTARGVVTIHDLDVLSHPEHEPRAFARRFRRAVTDSVGRADAIVAVSESVRRETIRTFAVTPDRVVTIPLAAGPQFGTSTDASDDRARARRALGVAGPYVLFVGTTRPRKNLARLVEAFGDARRSASLPHSLVVAGDAGRSDRAVRGLVAELGLADAVRFAGRVPDDDLPAVYRSADALAFPSLLEGFGLPVLEAFACGTPVLTSATEALEEVSGGAALLVDPTSVPAIADALVRAVTDADLRARLVAAGRARASEFSWDRAADAHVALWRRLADGERRPPGGDAS